MATGFNFILALIFCSLTLGFTSCKSSPQLKFQYSDLDSILKPKEISLHQLSKNYRLYQGQYIETEGRFYEGFEKFAIYPEKYIFSNAPKGFWLMLDSGFVSDRKYFTKMNGRRIRIKGIIDTTDKGHLGLYYATIRRIYYWEQQ
jgi:hypothetical protein